MPKLVMVRARPRGAHRAHLAVQTADWTALKAHQPFFAVVNSHEVEYDIYDRKSASKARVGLSAPSAINSASAPDLGRADLANVMSSISGSRSNSGSERNFSRLCRQRRKPVEHCYDRP